MGPYSRNLSRQLRAKRRKKGQTGLPPGPATLRDGQDPFYTPAIEQFENIDPTKTLHATDLNISNWYPLPNGQGDPTAVLFVFPLQDDAGQVIFRVNSKNAMDGLIARLLHHRAEVWGEQ